MKMYDVLKLIHEGELVLVSYKVNGDLITDEYTFVTYDVSGDSIVVRLKELALFIPVEDIQSIKVLGDD